MCAGQFFVRLIFMERVPLFSTLRSFDQRDPRPVITVSLVWSNQTHLEMPDAELSPTSIFPAAKEMERKGVRDRSNNTQEPINYTNYKQ